MEARRRRIAVAGTALAALGLAAGGVTYAATSGGGPQQESNALAEAINAREGTHLTGDDIQAALTDVLRERLDAAVKAGKLTQDEADRMLERAKDGGVPLGPGFGERHMMFRGGPIGDAAAKALGSARTRCATSSRPASRSRTSPRRATSRLTRSSPRSATRSWTTRPPAPRRRPAPRPRRWPSGS